MNLGLDIINRVRGFYLEGDGLSGKAMGSVAVVMESTGVTYVLTCDLSATIDIESGGTYKDLHRCGCSMGCIRCVSVGKNGIISM